jgi:hypothetical protein
MESLLPKSFIQTLSGILAIIALIFALISLFTKLRQHTIRLSALLFISSLALFSNHWSTYFAALFIIATTVTELEFLERLAAIIRGSKHYFDYKIAEAGSAQTPSEDNLPDRRPMEYKILQTLWTKQVNYFPEYSAVWTFRIGANTPIFLEYREAASKLIGEGLISESDKGQLYLTKEGFEYCKKHYKEWPPEQWWPEETINENKLRIALGEEKPEEVADS